MSFKKIIGYGLLPSTFLAAFLSLLELPNHLESNGNPVFNYSLTAICLIVLFLFIKPVLNTHTIIYYLGYKHLSTNQWATYFFGSYILLFILSVVISPEYYSNISVHTWVVMPFITFTFLVLLKKRYVYKIVFVKLTPRVYIDLTYFELHTKEMIESYDIEPIYKDELNLPSLYLYYALVQSKYKDNLEHAEINDVKVNLDTIVEDTLLVSALDENGEQVWNGFYKLDGSNKEKLQSIKERLETDLKKIIVLIESINKK